MDRLGAEELEEQEGAKAVGYLYADVALDSCSKFNVYGRPPKIWPALDRYSSNFDCLLTLFRLRLSPSPD